jgi:hypothetical protein
MMLRLTTTCCRLLLFALLVLVSTTARATAYFVSSSIGDDTRDGKTSSTPWRTLGKVEAEMQAGNIGAGDAVLLNRGDVWPGPFVIRSGGAPGMPLIIGAYGSHPDLPRIDGTGQTSTVQISGRSNLSIFGLWVSGATFRGMNVDGGTSNLLIQDCFIQGGENGVRISGGSNNSVTLRRVTVRDTRDGVWVGNYSSFTNLFLDNIDSGRNTGSGFVAAHGANQGVGLLLKRCKFIGNSGNGATLRGFNQVNFVGCDMLANAGHGIAIYNNADGVIVQGTAARDNWLNGIQFSQDSTKVSESIKNVTIFASAFERNGEDGVAFRGNGTKARVESTRANQNENDGFNVKGTWTGVVFGSCLAESNGTDGIGSNGDGYSFHNSTSGVIISSSARDNKKSAVANVDGSNVTMANNIFVNQTSGTWPLVHCSGSGTFRLWHNTIVTGANQGFNVRIQGGAFADVRNNIIWGGQVGIYNFAATVQEDRNIFWNMEQQYNGVTPGASSMFADPVFANMPAFDFTPQANSPAVDAAIWVGIGSDNKGQARVDRLDVMDTGEGAVTYGDIGALELPF